MLNKILLPLDGSKLAEVALPFAAELARQFDSELILVFVNESNRAPDENWQKYLQQVADTLQSPAGSFSHKPDGLPALKVRQMILSGHAAEKIVEFADAERVGQIVIATHGQSGITRWALGSVADKVARATTRPVLLIRARDARSDVREKGKLQSILVPLDGSNEAEEIIPYVEELAARLKAKVILFQVLTRGYQTPNSYVPLPESIIAANKADVAAYLNRVGDRFKQKGIDTAAGEGISAEINFGNAANEIIQFADQIQADLVAMTTHGRSGVGRWVMGSVAERILHEGNTPLLLVRSRGATGQP